MLFILIVFAEALVPIAMAGFAFVFAVDKVSIVMVGVRPAVEEPSKIDVAFASPIVIAVAVSVSKLLV